MRSTVPSVLLLSGLLPSCAIGVRANISPTIDTRGRVGVQASVGGGFGLTQGEERRRAWTIGVNGATGYVRGEGATVAAFGAIDYVKLEGLAWHGGVRYGIGTGLETERSFGMLGGAFAVLPWLDGRNDLYRGGGVELRVVWLGGAESEDVVELAVGGVYGLYMMHDLKVIP